MKFYKDPAAQRLQDLIALVDVGMPKNGLALEDIADEIETMSDRIVSLSTENKALRAQLRAAGLKCGVTE